jgi:hypothetical protein
MNHSKKTYPQWINSMTLVINQLLDQQEVVDDQTKETKKEETIEDKDTIEESTMFLWDWCLDSDDEQVEDNLCRRYPDPKGAPKDYNLCNKGVVANTPLPSKIVPSPRKISPPTTAQKPNNPAQANSNPNTSQENKTPNRYETHALEYNVIEDLKKTKANISLYDICALPQQRDLILDTFKSTNPQKNIVVVMEQHSQSC